VAGHVAALAGPDGLALPDVRPTGRPWQEPDGGFESFGRTDLHAGVDSEAARGPAERPRPAYVDWDAVREAAASTAAAPALLHAEGADALRAAERDPGGRPEQRARADAVTARATCCAR
jgi:FO synthase